MKRKYSKISANERSLISKKYDDGKGPSCIATKLEVSVKILASITNLYKSTERIQVKTNLLPRTMKIGNDVCVTLLDLKKKLLEQLNIDASVISINKVITTLNFTFKRIQLIPHSRNTNKNLE